MTIKTLLLTQLLTSILNQSFAESKESQGMIKLYQIGQKGRYCISLNGDESGCISGSNDAGKPMNTLDSLKGYKFEFQNLSDAPHDMRFTGKNAEDLVPQDPKGPKALKQVTEEDPDTQQILCSFHGLQLGLGYRVLTEANKQDPLLGHRKVDGDNSDVSTSEPSASAPVMQTQLRDVSDFILTKGSAAEAARLVESRPELKEAYAKALAEKASQESKGSKELASKTKTPGAGWVSDSSGNEEVINRLLDETSSLDPRAQDQDTSFENLDTAGARRELASAANSARGSSEKGTLIFLVGSTLAEQLLAETENDLSKQLVKQGYGSNRMMGTLPELAQLKKGVGDRSLASPSLAKTPENSTHLSKWWLAVLAAVIAKQLLNSKKQAPRLAKSISSTSKDNSTQAGVRILTLLGLAASERKASSKRQNPLEGMPKSPKRAV